MKTGFSPPPCGYVNAQGNSNIYFVPVKAVCGFGGGSKMDEDEIADLVSAIQQGEYEVIKEALQRRLVPPNVRDSQGCTLLHWAAINNRYSIANLLIDHGADIGASGGMLDENPLQWALRRKYYSMVDLLIRKGTWHNVLQHRSKQGDNALMLARKLGIY